NDDGKHEQQHSSNAIKHEVPFAGQETGLSQRQVHNLRLGTVSVASELAIHLPSTTRQYSQVPGGAKRSSFGQRPSREGVMGVALGCQLLKIPATQTVLAP